MPSKNDTFSMLVVSGACIIAIYLGWDRYRTGAIPERGSAFNRALNVVNILNWFLRRPEQQHLTARQVRLSGVLMMLGGSIGLVGVVLLALRLAR